MATETKVEAVAWAVVVNGKPDFADIRKWECEREAAIFGDVAGTISVEPLYPSSEITALEGEVAEQSAWADKWKALHDAVSLAHEVQARALARALGRADAAERRVAELEAALRGLVSAGKKYRNTVVQTRGLSGNDAHDFAINHAESALSALTKDSP